MWRIKLTIVKKKVGHSVLLVIVILRLVKRNKKGELFFLRDVTMGSQKRWILFCTLFLQFCPLLFWGVLYDGKGKVSGRKGEYMQI